MTNRLKLYEKWLDEKEKFEKVRAVYAEMDEDVRDLIPLEEFQVPMPERVQMVQYQLLMNIV
jgi:hypothetical protein